MNFRVLLARRQSPDWEGLSRDFRANKAIDRTRYIPQTDIPGFPSNVADCIDIWNNTFKIDFFTCRMVLSKISMSNNISGTNIVTVNYDEIDKIIDEKSRGEFILFFHDDDDLFDPNIANIFSNANISADVIVFPLIRYNQDLVTFVRDGAEADCIIGRRQPFKFRYQTNNYGIVSSSVTPDRLVKMKDHVEASIFAESALITDITSTKMVSATIKSPCSASLLPKIAFDKEGRDLEFSGFILKSRELNIPDNLRWFYTAIQRSARLFDLVRDGRGYEDLVGDGLLNPPSIATAGHACGLLTSPHFDW